MAMKRSTRLPVKSPKRPRASDVTAVQHVLGERYDAAKFLKALEAVVSVVVIDSRRYNHHQTPSKG